MPGGCRPGGDRAGGSSLTPPLPPLPIPWPQDGRNWARIEADHHTGALFDVGASGEHDELHVNSTQASGLGVEGGGIAI